MLQLHLLAFLCAGDLTRLVDSSTRMAGSAKPAKLGDMPAFFNVEVNDLVVSRTGNHFVIEFDQPAAAAKDPSQVEPEFTTLHPLRCASRNLYAFFARFVGHNYLTYLLLCLA